MPVRAAVRRPAQSSATKPLQFERGAFSSQVQRGSLGFGAGACPTATQATSFVGYEKKGPPRYCRKQDASASRVSSDREGVTPQACVGPMMRPSSARHAGTPGRTL